MGEDDENTGGKWVPWEWIEESEVLCARWYHSLSFSEIGSRIPTPDEPWQCVPVALTEEMVDEALSTIGALGEQVDEAWSDMLAAAPKPEDA